MNPTEEYLAENPKLIPKRVSLLKKKTEWLTVERTGLKSKMIEGLSQSNKDLEQKMELWKSKENCIKDNEQLNSVAELTREVDILNKHLRTEKDYLSDLKDQIQHTELEILRKKEASRKKIVHPSYMQNAERCKESYQLKLHAISAQLSDEQTKNSELREHVRVLMTERKRFNKEFNGLLEKLEEGKKHMKELDTSVNQALRMKENMQNKLNILHERETKQKVAQEEEMRDLQMRLENESTYKRFFAKKNKVRAMLPSVAKDIVNKRKSDLEKLSENHETYGDVMILCEDDSSRKPVKHLDLVNVIKTREERNMSLFNFVTRQYDELQVLREKVLEQERKFEDKYSEQEEKVDRHEMQRGRLESLKNEMEERQLGNVDDIRANLRLQEKLFAGIDQLVKLTKADISTITLLLGENNKTSQFNYNLFLQAVERRIIELLNATNLQIKDPLLSNLKTLETKCKTLQSSIREKSCDLEVRVILTKPCNMCFPVKRETKFTRLLE